MSECLRCGTDDAIVFLNEKIYRVRVPRRDIILVLEELVTVGRIGGLVEGLV